MAIEGNRVRFCDPLMSRGVYLRASPATRRSMHRRLSAIVAEPELKARHLAWAATEGDPQTLAALDEAARSAHARGAPTTAAELLDIAMHLGGDTPQRRIRSAGHHLAAGDAATARQLLETTANGLPPGELRSKAFAQLAAVCVVDDNLLEAAALLERALGEARDPAQRTRISIALAFALANGGHPGAAADRIDEATAQAERLGHPPLLCQALTLGVHLRFLRGGGVDESALRRAMTLEGRSRVPTAFRPSVHRALLSAWTGRLREAREELLAVRRECMDHGEETELIPVTFNSFLVELWLGHVDDARAVADDAMERAAALGGDLARGLALTMRAALAALTGDAEQARADTGAALEATNRCGASTLAMWPTSIRGFLELSLQEHRTALATLEPMLAALEPSAPTEIITAVFVPDAVEAMIETGALDRAEALIQRLERTGTRLGRPWALAVGARCRSLLFAATGDLESATRSAHEALRAHARQDMPFERARTELVLGRLQRRRRQRDAAAASLRRCLAVFDELGATVWADRTRAELARVDVTPGAGTGLTSSEKRVAELAAEGRTNRDIAATLFISPKTVEANLARAYRKLGIRCRAQLAGCLHFPEKVGAR
ncbi:helix-turn-helix transcriptional regulator [Mycolicibacterium palauense]|uniref:helix-turn-helix transcriptional regulator n=1 Tax=Mycolicibacterium palauense TaxID=2034511 RepID=UPI000BFEB3C1|nr:LuxR family transcriptional regulator [Mycolicibacterium palauense]